MNRIASGGLAIVVVVVLCSVATGAGKGSVDQLEKVVDFDRSTATRSYELVASPGVDSARLRVTARVRSGHIGWTLTDPDGRQHVSGHGSRGRIETDTGTLESPRPGRWVLTFELERATGHYRIDWQTR